MLDTIVLMIRGREHFRISYPERFNQEYRPRIYPQLSETERKQRSRRTKRLRTFRLDVSPKEWHVPQVEIYEFADHERRRVTYTMRVQFSVGKLLSGNNLQEEFTTPGVAEFSTLLQDRLGYVGIHLNIQDTLDAELSELDVGKNMMLPPELPMSAILSEAMRMEMGKAFQVTKTRYINGDAVHFFAGQRELVLYEKIRDILKPKVKSIDKQKAAREREIVEMFNLEKHEVCRFEYRLKHRSLIRTETNAILGRPLDTPVRFEDVLSEHFSSKSMLLQAWGRLVERPANQLALISPPDEITFLRHFMTPEKGHRGMNRQLGDYGLAMALRLCTASLALQEIHRASSKDHPERLRKKITQAVLIAEKLPRSDKIAFVTENLEKFDPITLDSLEKWV